MSSGSGLHARYWFQQQQGDGAVAEISTSVPPAPKVMIGPKVGSRFDADHYQPFGPARNTRLKSDAVDTRVQVPFWTTSMMSW